MSLKTIRRLAADILGVGQNRIVFDMEKKEELEKAITREDVKELISKGIIKKKPIVGKRKEKKKKANRGRGSRKGKKHAIKSSKEKWMEKVRALRKLLAQLIREGRLSKEHKKDIYRKIKGNFYKGKRSMLLHLKERKLLKEPKEAKESAKKKSNKNEGGKA